MHRLESIVSQRSVNERLSSEWSLIDCRRREHSKNDLQTTENHVFPSELCSFTLLMALFFLKVVEDATQNKAVSTVATSQLLQTEV